MAFLWHKNINNGFIQFWLIDNKLKFIFRHRNTFRPDFLLLT